MELFGQVGKSPSFGGGLFMDILIYRAFAGSGLPRARLLAIAWISQLSPCVLGEAPPNPDWRFGLHLGANCGSRL